MPTLIYLSMPRTEIYFGDKIPVQIFLFESNGSPLLGSSTVRIAIGNSSSVALSEEVTCIGGFISYEINTFVLESKIYNVTASFIDGNGMVNYFDSSISVLPKVLNVSVLSCSKVYSEMNPNFTYEINGLVQTHTKSQMMNLIHLSCSASRFSNCGDYIINASFVDTNNTGILKDYDVVFFSAYLSINRMDQYINLYYPEELEYYGSEFSYELSSETTAGLWCDFELYDNPSNVSIIDSTFLKVNDVGGFWIKINQSGTNNYNPAPEKWWYFNVVPKLPLNTWMSDIRYSSGESIMYKGQKYKASSECEGVRPSTSEAIWSLIPKGASINIDFKGSWISKQYFPGDLVSYKENSYICLSKTPQYECDPLNPLLFQEIDYKVQTNKFGFYTRYISGRTYLVGNVVYFDGNLYTPVKSTTSSPLDQTNWDLNMSNVKVFDPNLSYKVGDRIIAYGRRSRVYVCISDSFQSSYISPLFDNINFRCLSYQRTFVDEVFEESPYLQTFIWVIVFVVVLSIFCAYRTTKHKIAPSFVL